MNKLITQCERHAKDTCIVEQYFDLGDKLDALRHEHPLDAERIAMMERSVRLMAAECRKELAADEARIRENSSRLWNDFKTALRNEFKSQPAA